MSDAVARPSSRRLPLACYTARDAAIRLLESPRRMHEFREALVNQGCYTAYTQLVRDAARSSQAMVPETLELDVADLIRDALVVKHGLTPRRAGRRGRAA